MSQPDVVVAEPTGEIGQVEDTDLEKADDGKEPLDPDWKYDRLEYKGDNLAVRKAKMQALMAYQLSSGKYITMERQNDASGLFLTEHFGPDTYDRIIERMSTPDDPDYTMKSFAEIVGKLVKMSIAQIRADAEAEKKALEEKK